LEEKVAAQVYKTENTAVGIRRADHATPSLPAIVDNNFADGRRSLCRYEPEEGGDIFPGNIISLSMNVISVKLVQYLPACSIVP
jgi:hypothetical protein